MLRRRPRSGKKEVPLPPVYEGPHPSSCAYCRRKKRGQCGTVQAVRGCYCRAGPAEGDEPYVNIRELFCGKKKNGTNTKIPAQEEREKEVEKEEREGEIARPLNGKRLLIDLNEPAVNDDEESDGMTQEESPHRDGMMLRPLYSGRQDTGNDVRLYLLYSHEAETDAPGTHENMCFVCKQDGGEFARCCEGNCTHTNSLGCRKVYHPHCLSNLPYILRGGVLTCPRHFCSHSGCSAEPQHFCRACPTQYCTAHVQREIIHTRLCFTCLELTKS